MGKSSVIKIIVFIFSCFIVLNGNYRGMFDRMILNEFHFFKQDGCIHVLADTGFQFIIKRQNSVFHILAEVIQVVFIFQQRCQFDVMGRYEYDVPLPYQCRKHRFGNGNRSTVFVPLNNSSSKKR